MVEAAQNYRVAIQGHHLTVSDAIRKHIDNRLKRLERILPHVLDVHVILSLQRIEHRAEIVMLLDHIKVVAHGVADDLYVAIDLAFDRLHERLVRYKERIKAHHAKGHSFVNMNVDLFEPNEVEEFNQEIEAQNRQRDLAAFPSVVRSEKHPLKLLTLKEAMMKIDLSNEPFLIFRAEEDQKIKVIYPLKEGGFGVITPE